MMSPKACRSKQAARSVMAARRCKVATLKLVTEVLADEAEGGSYGTGIVKISKPLRDSFFTGIKELKLVDGRLQSIMKLVNGELLSIAASMLQVLFSSGMELLCLQKCGSLSLVGERGY